MVPVDTDAGTLEQPTKPETKGTVVKENALADLPNRQKNILMFCFCLSMFM